MATRDTLYPEDELEKDFKPVAFDYPDEEGARYPIAIPEGGSWQPSPEDSPLIRTPEQSAAAYASRDQYAAELARANRNRDDDLRAEAGGNPQILQQAIRLQGLREYEKLLAGGATNSEAMRLAAPKLYFNHPQVQLKAAQVGTTPQMPSISEIKMTGGNAILADGKYRAFNRITPPKNLGFELDRKESDENVAKAARALTAAQKDSLMGDEDLIKQREAELKDAQQSRRNLVLGIKTPPAESKKITKEIAAGLLKQAKGDKEMARKLARDAGYSF